MLQHLGGQYSFKGNIGQGQLFRISLDKVQAAVRLAGLVQIGGGDVHPNDQAPRCGQKVQGPALSATDIQDRACAFQQG